MGLSTPTTGGGAPTDAEYVTGSSNSELSNETVVSPASDILVSGDIDGTIALSPGFDTFTQVSANHPALLTATTEAVTDGSTSAAIKLAVDESGGTTADYTFIVNFSPGSGSSGESGFNTISVLLPAGAQFEIRNSDDPRGENQIRTMRAQILSP